MARVLKVCIGDQGIEVGKLRFDSQGNREFSSFEYSEAWLANPRAFAISPSMPLVAGPHFSKKEGALVSPLPPALADTSPDSWGRNIIRRDTRENSNDAGPLNELDYLLAVDDFSRIGALRLKNEDGQEYLASEPLGRHNIPPVLQLNELGKSIASLERDDEITAAALKRLRQIGSALGGARPKCSVIDTDNSLLIAKFTSRHDSYDVERAEVLTLRLAKLCGLIVPTVRLDMSDELPVALIPRFDRSGAGRIPYISAQTMLQVPSADGSSYTAIAEAIRINSRNPKADLRELFNRIGFTVLVSNVDDHLKNHGFIYAGEGKWRLSPLFDVNPAPERHRELKTSIVEGGGSEASIDLLIDNSLFFDVTEEDAREWLHAMATTISERWRDLAKDCGMSRRTIDIYHTAFQHDETDKALKLGQPKIAFG